jgi:anti-sigma regulatory factor (Ser/Thr protein kinase)
MMGGVNVSRSFSASPGAIPELRHVTTAFAREHCGEDQQLVDDIALAVTEAGGNVVRHAYDNPPAGRIDLAAWIRGDELIVEVSDSGVGINAAAGSSGLGLGLPLIRRLAEVTVLENPGGGTCLRMAFPCGADRAGGAPWNCR